MKQTENEAKEDLLDIARRKGGLKTKADERNISKNIFNHI